MLISEAHARVGESVSGEHVRVFPPFDSSFFVSHIFWLVICFGFFYCLVLRIILPRIGGIIEMRRDRVAADLDQAARMKDEADAAAATYEEKLSGARERAVMLARAAADEARIRAEEERIAAEILLEKKLSIAERRISVTRDRAMQDIAIIAEETAAEIVNALVGKKHDKTSVSKVN